MRSRKLWLSLLCLVGALSHGATVFAAGRVQRVFADGGSFFFTVEGADMAGCPAARFILGDKTRQAMVLSAQAGGRLVDVSPGACNADGSTGVAVLYVY